MTCSFAFCGKHVLPICRTVLLGLPHGKQLETSNSGWMFSFLTLHDIPLFASFFARHSSHFSLDGSSYEQLSGSAYS